jgi:hypothetical protein
MHYSEISLTEIISAVVGLIIIITFFIMARRLLLIKRATESQYKIIQHWAIAHGIIKIGECKDCGKQYYVFENEQAWCRTCGKKVNAPGEDKQTKQTKDNPQV